MGDFIGHVQCYLGRSWTLCNVVSSIFNQSSAEWIFSF